MTLPVGETSKRRSPEMERIERLERVVQMLQTDLRDIFDQGSECRACESYLDKCSCELGDIAAEVAEREG